MRLLVTGGAGFLGSIVVGELLRAGHSVTVYDNLSRGHREAIHPQATLVEGDVADTPRLTAALCGCGAEAVLHFAAVINVGESMQRPEFYFRVNVGGTISLLEAMREAGVARIVFSSTAAVYGTPVRVPMNEEHPLAPESAYGDSKLMVERLLEWSHRVYGLRYAALRYFNAAGSHGGRGEDHHPETHLIPLCLQVALGQRPHIAVFGNDWPTPDGTCIRDYIHVSDLASAHLLALEALASRPRMIYNLGTGRGFTVRQVVEAARRVTGHSIPACEEKRRAGDAPELVAASEKIRRELGWQPRVTELDTIVASAWEWHRSHPQGYATQAAARK